MKKVLLDRLASGSAKDEMIYSKLVKDGLLKLNVGLIFTNGDLNDVKDVIDKCKIQAPARQGSVAPLDGVQCLSASETTQCPKPAETNDFSLLFFQQ